MPSGTSSSWALAKSTSWSGWRVGLAGHGELHHPSALVSGLHRAFEFGRRALGSPSERCATGIRRPPLSAAPVGDPAVVRPAHRLRVLDVVAVGFPGQLEAGIDDRGVESLESSRSTRSLASQAPSGTRSPYLIRGSNSPFSRVTWPICATAPKLPPRLTRDGTPLTSRYSSPSLSCFHADRVSPVLGLAVLLPAFDRFQDVAVGVYGARIFELVNFLFDACHFEPTSLRFELS